MSWKSLVFAMATLLPAAAMSQEPAEDSSAVQAESQFVGRYDGNSFETAMGMVVRADGTFEWGLSVGALDLRAQGTWFESYDKIIFASDPKPVPPEFFWSGIEQEDGGPFLRIIWQSTAKPFSYAHVRGLCTNGELLHGPVMADGWSPKDSCDRVATIQFYIPSYDFLSQPIELIGNRTTRPGQTIRIAFHPNDLGVANFDGVTGRLEDGRLQIQSDLGVMTLRKVSAQNE
ncbi:MAG: hypothetical protein AAGI28_13310 [Pseudomonadota bacterium]